MDKSITLPHTLWRPEGFRVGNERYDMTLFAKAAADCDAELNEFILQLGNNENTMDKLKQIINFRFDVQTRTFQDIALPILTLVTRPKFANSPHVSDVKKIYRAFCSNLLFLMRVRKCIENETTALANAGLLAPSVNAFALLLNIIAQKLTTLLVDDDIYLLVKSFAEWVQTNERHEESVGFQPAVASLQDTLELCMEFVPTRRPDTNAQANYLISDIHDPVDRANPSYESQMESGFALGLRHDNDDPEFRNIDVIPTDVEMRCLEPAYLPKQLPASEGFDAHLDFHYRLLREDVLAQIKRGVQWLLAPQTLSKCFRTQNWTPPREANVPRLNVALDVHLDKIKGSIYKGVMFVISAAQPSFKNQTVTKANLKTFWEKEQRYKVGSLVCIASNVGVAQARGFLHQRQPPLPVKPNGDDDDDDGSFPRFADLDAEELIFATVCENNINDFTTDPARFSIGLKLLETANMAALVTKLTTPHQRNILIEVRGLFFPAYEPILRTLQSFHSRSLTPELQQCLFGDVGQEQAWKAKPRYAQGIPEYDLQFLVKKGDKSGANLRHAPVEDYEQLVEYLRTFQSRDCLTLDETQVEAFAAAMTQQMCLIQGPPGTGKSYVGTKIVQGILKQRHLDIGPILCVCYTNHALDQFLEDLVKDGVSEHNIVRVGGRSKSEMLEPRTLSVLKKDSWASRQERYRFGCLRSACQEIEEDYLKDYVDEWGSPKSFFRWMRNYHYSKFALIVGFEDEDGFHAQNQSKKAVQKRWASWERGETRYFGGNAMWRMDVHQRVAMAEEWRAEWEDSAHMTITDELDEYNDCVEKAEEINNASMLRILQCAKVVGITTTGCAMHQALIRALAPEIVVCEEAGEVLEAHLLACLSQSTQQVIQIGDHMQLRPILNEHMLSYQSRSGYNLDVSMFERLVRQREDAANGMAKVPGSLVTLHVQRRMRPEICDLIRHTIYPTLCDGPQVHEYPDTRGFTHNLWFLDHDQPENTGELSRKNSFEAELLVELVSYAIKQGYGLDEITILTPYLGQLVLIRSILQAKNFRFALDEKDAEAIQLAGMEDESDVSDESDDEEKEAATKQAAGNDSGVVIKTLKDCVRLSTVDNFQGNESHLVFISTVRSNEGGRTGFLKTFNRVNVMLSRAKSGMFIIGSAATMRRCSKATMFNGVLDILEDKARIGRSIGLCCQKHGTVTQVASALDIRQHSPDGGCGVKCNQRLSCGHSCPKLCHADDPRHVAGICMEPCVKRVAVCGHLCKSRCYEKCHCVETIPVHTFPCGHSLENVACSTVHAGLLRCTMRVEVQLPFCKHPRTLYCSQAQTLQRAVEQKHLKIQWEFNCQCTVKCGCLRTECAHPCQQLCGTCMESNLDRSSMVATESEMNHAGMRSTHFGKCLHPCDRMLLCGHSCTSHCHPADSCPPCSAKCRNECSHSKCPLKCKDPCASCAQPCTWSCAHSNKTCDLPCGSPCTRLPCDLRCPKLLVGCGHQCPGLCGEPCLTSAFCRECPPEVCTQGDEVVDLVMAAALKDHDPEESPLVQLRCGHCFTVETMDGCLGMADFYEQDQDGAWVGVKPLKAPENGPLGMKCPVCRAPVSGVHRYGRLVNFYQLTQSELKYLQVSTSQIESSKAMRQRSQYNGTYHGIDIDVVNLRVAKFSALVKQETPTQEIWTKENSRLEQLGYAGDSLNLNSFRNIMQSQVKILLSLELLELLTLKLQTIRATQRSLTRRGQVNSTFDEGIALEKTLEQMCRAAASHRSASEATLLGMQLRVAFLQHSLPEDESTFWRSRESILCDLHDSRDALQEREQGVTATMVERAQRLCELAERLSHLSKAEKDEIFKVFAIAKGVFAQGFGGRWYVVQLHPPTAPLVLTWDDIHCDCRLFCFFRYQCPSGHPYVITECGGAMEQSTCPECGAAIGGMNHRLDASNSDAASFFA